MVDFDGSLHLTAVDRVEDGGNQLLWITGSGDVNLCEPVAAPQGQSNETWYEVVGHYALAKFRRYTNAQSVEVLERYRSDGAVMRYEELQGRWRPQVFFDSYDNEWTYHWNASSGQLEKIVDPRGVEVRFGWTSSTCTVTYVRGATTFSDWTWSFQLDAFGRLLTLTLPQTTHYDVGSSGPLFDTTNPTSDARSLSFSYHSGGQLDQISDSRLSSGGGAHVVRAHEYQTVLGAVRLKKQTDELGIVHSFSFAQTATSVVVSYRAAETTAATGDPTTMDFVLPKSVLTSWTTPWLPVEVTVTPGALGKPRAAISDTPEPTSLTWAVDYGSCACGLIHRRSPIRLGWSTRCSTTRWATERPGRARARSGPEASPTPGSTTVWIAAAGLSGSIRPVSRRRRRR